MGVEPTRQNFSIRLIGFEDRGRHPPSNAYQSQGNLIIDLAREIFFFSVCKKTSIQNPNALVQSKPGTRKKWFLYLMQGVTWEQDLKIGIFAMERHNGLKITRCIQ